MAATITGRRKPYYERTLSFKFVFMGFLGTFIAGLGVYFLYVDYFNTDEPGLVGIIWGGVLIVAGIIVFIFAGLPMPKALIIDEVGIWLLKHEETGRFTWEQIKVVYLKEETTTDTESTNKVILSFVAERKQGLATLRSSPISYVSKKGGLQPWSLRIQQYSNKKAKVVLQ